LRHSPYPCGIRVPPPGVLKADRYKTASLKTADVDAARERAFNQDADLRFRIKHEVPISNRPFSEIREGLC
jgi:integrase